MIIEYQPENNRAKVIEPTFQHNVKDVSVYLDDSVINSLKNSNILDKIDDFDLHISIGDERWEISEPIPNRGQVEVAGDILFRIYGKIILQNNEINCIL